MPTNLATIVGGPCLISYNGSTFRSKADVILDPTVDQFVIENDLYGPVDTRVGDQLCKVRFTPEGRFADVSTLHPYLTVSLGSMVTPIHTCGAVVHGDDTIAVAATTLPAGTPVSFGSTGTLPAGLTAAVVYLGPDAAGLRKVYTTAALAITAGVDQIDITDNGTGTLRFVIQKALVILGADGVRHTFHNAAVVKSPTFFGSRKKTMWGEVEFECFAKNGVARTEANSVCTDDTAAFSDTTFTQAGIVTQAYSLTWGAAPWAAIYTKDGVTIDTTIELAPVEDDLSGILTRRIKSISVTAKAQPMGIDWAALRAKVNLDGASGALGRSLAGDNLSIIGTDIYARLYSAALVGGPAQWKSDLERTGELTWQANRTFTAGAPNPLLYFGTAAPV